MNANLWIALSEQAITEFKAYRSDPAGYSGPMDETAFKILSAMSDLDTVQRMFKPVTISTVTYRLFSLNVRGSQKVADALSYMESNWPAHFVVVGAWWWDGRQVGTNWIDEADHSQGVSGTPLYPIHAQAWRLMPDQYEYDIDGNVINTIYAASNADLRDVNLSQGQEPRSFT